MRLVKRQVSIPSSNTGFLHNSQDFSMCGYALPRDNLILKQHAVKFSRRPPQQGQVQYTSVNYYSWIVFAKGKPLSRNCRDVNLINSPRQHSLGPMGQGKPFALLPGNVKNIICDDFLFMLILIVISEWCLACMRFHYLFLALWELENY